MQTQESKNELNSRAHYIQQRAIEIVKRILPFEFSKYSSHIDPAQEMAAPAENEALMEAHMSDLAESAKLLAEEEFEGCHKVPRKHWVESLIQAHDKRFGIDEAPKGRTH